MSGCLEYEEQIDSHRTCVEGKIWIALRGITAQLLVTMATLSLAYPVHSRRLKAMQSCGMHNWNKYVCAPCSSRLLPQKPHTQLAT